MSDLDEHSLEEENLYRKEALAAFSVRHYDRPIARPSRLMEAGCMLVVLIAVGAAIAVTTGTYARKETVPGWLQPDKGLTRLTAGQHGLVEDVMVEEGSQVEQGEPILVLSSDNTLVDGGGRATEALLVEITREEVELARQTELVERLQVENTAAIEASLVGLELEKASMQSQIEEQGNRVAIATDLLTRYESLRGVGIADIQIEAQREEVAVQRQAKNGLMQRSHALDREIRTAQDRLRLLPLETARQLSELESRMAGLAARKIELSSRGRQVITAPVSGTVASLGARAGNTIDPSRVLVEILPQDSVLYAEIYIPSRAIGFVEESMVVRLMYDAFPYQTYGSGEGRVNRVTDTVLRPEEIPTPLGMQESAYKARVALHSQTIEALGRSFPLRPGMALQAEIILERRTFLQLILAPVIARRGWQPSADMPPADDPAPVEDVEAPPSP